MSKEEQREKNSLNYYQVNWENLKANKHFLQIFVVLVNKKLGTLITFFDVMNNANRHESGLKTSKLKKIKDYCKANTASNFSRTTYYSSTVRIKPPYFSGI